MLAVIVVAPAFTPQTGLWVLFAVVIARPYRAELVAVTITQVLYAFALWGWLDGALTSAQSGPYWLYWLAILARAAVEIYLLARVLWDVLHPERDRFGSVWSDPLGGELHAVAPRPAPALSGPGPCREVVPRALASASDRGGHRDVRVQVRLGACRPTASSG